MTERAKPGSCEWTAQRLALYAGADPVLSDLDFERLDAHLATCARCRNLLAPHELAIEEQTKALYPDERLIQFDSKELAEAIASGRIGRPGWKNHKQTDSPHSARPWFRPVRLAAAACLLAVAIPVLAYVGELGLRRLHTFISTTPGTQADGAFHCTGKQGMVLPTVFVEERRDVSDRQAKDAAAKQLEGFLSDTVLKATAVSMLPHDEEEYETWARREYPHVMWVYDVASGNTPKVPAPGPAAALVTFGADSDGPTIALPDRMQGLVTIAMRTKKVWDGTPENWPAWVAQLYAQEPVEEWPSGWRALLICSGEVFKFDWPATLESANCLPTAEAVLLAAAVAGVEARVVSVSGESTLSAWDKPSLPKPVCLASLDATPPGGYVRLLELQPPLAKTALAYLCAACRLSGSAELEQLANAAEGLLGQVCQAGAGECVLNQQSQAIAEFFNLKAEFIERLEGTLE